MARCGACGATREAAGLSVSLSDTMRSESETLTAAAGGVSSSAPRIRQNPTPAPLAVHEAAGRRVAAAASPAFGPPSSSRASGAR